jgi:rubrerythrin
MAKKLYQMTLDEVQQEMSIAGSPEKITQLGRDILALIGEKVDRTNGAELINVEFMLKRITAEIKLYQRMYDSSHRPQN